MKNLVFGSTGLIGKTFFELNSEKNSIIYTSTKHNKKNIYWNLNNDLKNFPIKKVKNCFFFASPRMLNKNFVNDKFKEEYYWLKNVIKNIEIEKIIYISSSSIYYKKDHKIGKTKKLCENLILKKKNKFKHYQIWRPFNLVGSKPDYSDHFHIKLFNLIFKKKVTKYQFVGNSLDERGYSDVKDFVKKILFFSNKKLSFTKDYGNKNSITMNAMISLYNKFYYKKHKKKLIPTFLSIKKNINIISSVEKKCIYYKGKSINVINNFLKNSI